MVEPQKLCPAFFIQCPTLSAKFKIGKMMVMGHVSKNVSSIRNAAQSRSRASDPARKVFYPLGGNGSWAIQAPDTFCPICRNILPVDK
ncbi:hypothetical protein [Oscillibacter ruminantium]